MLNLEFPAGFGLSQTHFSVKISLFKHESVFTVHTRGLNAKSSVLFYRLKKNHYIFQVLINSACKINNFVPGDVR